MAINQQGNDPQAVAAAAEGINEAIQTLWTMTGSQYQSPAWYTQAAAITSLITAFIADFGVAAYWDCAALIWRPRSPGDF